MSEREEQDKIIQQLVERLRDHTVPYKEGAWERYSAKYGKGRRQMWPYYWSAAALLLMTVGGFWLMRPSTDIAQSYPLVNQEVPVPENDDRSREVESPVISVPELEHETMVDPSLSTGVRVEPDSRPINNERLAVGFESSVTQSSVMQTVSQVITDTSSEEGRMAAIATLPPQVAVGTGPVERSDEMEGAATDVVAGVGKDGGNVNQAIYADAPQRVSEPREKWDLGLMVSPSLTSEAVNFGGGLTVAYHITDKFSVGSGVTIAQLGVGENPNYQPGNPGMFAPNSPVEGGPYFNGRLESALSYKREVSTTSSVVTLDIPIDFRYEVVKGFYTSVGISYVAVLNEQRTGHYIDKINTNTFPDNHLGSVAGGASTTFSYSSEKISAKPLRGNGYAGFVNFSVGKKMPLSDKLFLSVEPYFKLPVGRLAKEEMDFTNGGIRIVTGF